MAGRTADDALTAAVRSPHVNGRHPVHILEELMLLARSHRSGRRGPLALLCATLSTSPAALAWKGVDYASVPVHLVKDEAGGVTEAAHAAQEVAEDGSLGGVQLWRSRKEP